MKKQIQVCDLENEVLPAASDKSTLAVTAVLVVVVIAVNVASHHNS